MSALSFYSNFNYCPNSSSSSYDDDDIDFFNFTQQYPHLHHDYFPNDFDPASPFLYSDPDDILPFFSPPSLDNYFLFPSDDDFHPSKRQKLISPTQMYFDSTTDLYCDANVGVDNGGYLNLPEFLPVSWDTTTTNTAVENGIMFDYQAPAPALKKELPNNLSSQTIAARERRRKITAKTQELGELIPGGGKMNTAEMFHSAFKYVKFLQAQVAILQLEQEIGETTEKSGGTEILESPLIQEKLYLEEKCLVSEEFVRNIAEFPEIQSDSSIFNGINQVLQNQNNSSGS